MGAEHLADLGDDGVAGTVSGDPGEEPWHVDLALVHDSPGGVPARAASQGVEEGVVTADPSGAHIDP